MYGKRNKIFYIKIKIQKKSKSKKGREKMRKRQTLFNRFIGILLTLVMILSTVSTSFAAISMTDA